MIAGIVWFCGAYVVNKKKNSRAFMRSGTPLIHARRCQMAGANVAMPRLSSITRGRLSEQLFASDVLLGLEVAACRDTTEVEFVFNNLEYLLYLKKLGTVFRELYKQRYLYLFFFICLLYP